MFARLKLGDSVPCKFRCGIGFRRKCAFNAAHGISNVAGNVVAGRVFQRERYRLKAVAERLFGQVAPEGGRFATERKAQFAVVGFAGHVGNVGFRCYVIEPGYAVIFFAAYAATVFPYGQDHRHGYLECAVAVGNGFAFGQYFIVIVEAKRAEIADAPPQCLLATHFIFHLCALYGHARICLGTPGNGQRVAVFVFVLNLVERNFKRRTLVFLDAETCNAAERVLRPYRIVARKSALRQCEVGRSRAVSVGGDILFGHGLIVCVFQCQLDSPAAYGRLFKPVYVAQYYGCMHGLPGAVYLAVGVYRRGVAGAFVFVIIESVAGGIERQGVVRCAICARLPDVVTLSVSVCRFAFVVARQGL